MTNKLPSQQLPKVALEQLEVTTKPAGPSPVEAGDCLQVYQLGLDYLIGSLRRLGVPASDDEDPPHELFLVMLQPWEASARERPVRPWLFGIAFRVASSHRRKSTREVPSEHYETEDPRERPDESASAVQNRALLLKALAQVPMERRAVLIMHEVDETSMRDIASQLGIPLFTAYSRLRKARRELDAALSRLTKGAPRVR